MGKNSLQWGHPLVETSMSGLPCPRSNVHRWYVELFLVADKKGVLEPALTGLSCIPCWLQSTDANRKQLDARWFLLRTETDKRFGFANHRLQLRLSAYLHQLQTARAKRIATIESHQQKLHVRLAELNSKARTDNIERHDTGHVQLKAKLRSVDWSSKGSARTSRSVMASRAGTRSMPSSPISRLGTSNPQRGINVRPVSVSLPLSSDRRQSDWQQNDSRNCRLVKSARARNVRTRTVNETRWDETDCVYLKDNSEFGFWLIFVDLQFDCSIESHGLEIHGSDRESKVVFTSNSVLYAHECHHAQSENSLFQCRTSAYILIPKFEHTRVQSQWSMSVHWQFTCYFFAPCSACLNPNLILWLVHEELRQSKPAGDRLLSNEHKRGRLLCNFHISVSNSDSVISIRHRNPQADPGTPNVLENAAFSQTLQKKSNKMFNMYRMWCPLQRNETICPACGSPMHDEGLDPHRGERACIDRADDSLRSCLQHFCRKTSSWSCEQQLFITHNWFKYWASKQQSLLWSSLFLDSDPISRCDSTAFSPNWAIKCGKGTIALVIGTNSACSSRNVLEPWSRCPVKWCTLRLARLLRKSPRAKSPTFTGCIVQ